MVLLSIMFLETSQLLRASSSQETHMNVSVTQQWPAFLVYAKCHRLPWVRDCWMSRPPAPVWGILHSKAALNTDLMETSPWAYIPSSTEGTVDNMRVPVKPKVPVLPGFLVQSLSQVLNSSWGSQGFQTLSTGSIGLGRPGMIGYPGAADPGSRGAPNTLSWIQAGMYGSLALFTKSLANPRHFGQNISDAMNWCSYWKPLLVCSVFLIKSRGSSLLLGQL